MVVTLSDELFLNAHVYMHEGSLVIITSKFIIFFLAILL